MDHTACDMLHRKEESSGPGNTPDKDCRSQVTDFVEGLIVDS